MFLVMIVLLVIAAGAVLFVQIRKDGFGSRPAPRSHYDDFGTHVLLR